LGGLDNLANGSADSLRETSDESTEDLGEDHGDVLLAQIGIGQEVEMSLEPLGKGGSTTARWSHSRNEDDILDPHERLLLFGSVVPSLMIHPLSDELDWWLGTILFLLWHVQIINENDEPLAGWWTINTFSSLLELLVEGLLGLVG